MSSFIASWREYCSAYRDSGRAVTGRFAQASPRFTRW